MFTIRNIGGVALFLAGTTWLWLTPAFASRDVSTTGAAWAITRVLALLTVAGFCAATYGLFARHGWWEPAALTSAGVGLLALIVFWVAATGGGEAIGTVAWNVYVHIVMIGGISVLLLTPRLENWVDHHVMAT